MAVAEDEGRIGPVVCADGVHDRPFGALDDLGVRAATPEELDEPVRGGAHVAEVARVGADAGNAQVLAELLEVHVGDNGDFQFGFAHER